MRSSDASKAGPNATPMHSPIDKVPDEILAHIFTLSKPSCNCTMPKPHILCAVNRRWRRVAIGLASLWNLIILSFSDFRRSPLSYTNLHALRIERSRFLPLDIELDFGDVTFARTKEMEQPFLELILPYIGRWRNIEATGYAPSDFTHFINSMNLRAALLLQKIHILTPCTMSPSEYTALPIEDLPHHGHSIFRKQGMLSLRSVRLVGICHLSSIPLHDLTSLDLRNQGSELCRPSYAELCDLFAASPALENLTLHSVNFAFREEEDFAPFTFLSLKKLSMNFRLTAKIDNALVRILSLLVAPALEEMELICMGTLHTLELFSLLSKKSPRPDFPNLRTFKLAICSSRNRRVLLECVNYFCSSTTTFFSIRNAVVLPLPPRTEVVYLDPGDADKTPPFLAYSAFPAYTYPSVKLIRWLDPKTEEYITFRGSDSVTGKHEEVPWETLEYTGEFDSDALAAERVEDEEQEEWDLGDEDEEGDRCCCSDCDDLGGRGGRGDRGDRGGCGDCGDSLCEYCFSD